MTPSASQLESPVPSHDGPVLEVAAKGEQYLTTELKAPADVPFRILFDNADRYEHNVTIMPKGVERTIGRCRLPVQGRLVRRSNVGCV